MWERRERKQVLDGWRGKGVEWARPERHLSTCGMNVSK
jgi:hypothetical protein